MIHPVFQGHKLGYSEILRVIGQYMDRQNLGDGRIIETADGIILQGVVQLSTRAGQRETYQLTVEDISDLRADATAQRGKLL